jgi:hypothetical protein
MKNLKSWILVLTFAQAGMTQGVIRFKTRTIDPTASSTVAASFKTPAAAKQHFLILFGSNPGPDVIAELEARRIQVLAIVPENALMVSAVKLNLQGLDVIWSGPMDASDKISPMVSQAAGSYLVIWQPDTDVTSNTEEAQNLGFTFIQNSNLLAGQSLVSGAFSALPTLAALDQVSYILPASAELQNGDAIIGCPGATTRVGPAAQYVKATSGWQKDANGKVALGFYFESLTPQVPESAVRSEIARAFAMWARYANITITAVTQPAQNRTIDVLFARYAHGDAYPFSGPGGVIAHTFYPAPSNPEPLAGDMHLNADESWSVGGGVDLFSVALHEAGHALGLGHSDDPNAVMYPYYKLQTGLTADDIAGIQALYGPPVTAVSTSSVPTSSTAATTSNSGTGTTSTSAKPTTSTGTGTSSTSGTTTTTGTTTTSSTAPKVTDTIAPTVTMVTPGASMVSTSSATITIGGTASDNVGVTSVTWTTSTGGAGKATGTTSWSAVVPVLVGNNTITVRAYDAAGNSSWRAVTVVRNQ